MALIWVEHPEKLCRLYITTAPDPESKNENHPFRFQDVRLSIAPTAAPKDAVHLRRSILKYGFRGTANPNEFFRPIEKGKGFGLDLQKFAADTGGKVVSVESRDTFLSSPWIDRITAENPRTAALTDLRSLGLNANGDEVFTDRAGVRYVVNADAGRLAALFNTLQSTQTIKHPESGQSLQKEDPTKRSATFMRIDGKNPGRTEDRMASAFITWLDRRAATPDLLNAFVSLYSEGDLLQESLNSRLKDSISTNIARVYADRVHTDLEAVKMGLETRRTRDFEGLLQLGVNLAAVMPFRPSETVYHPGPLATALIMKSAGTGSGVHFRIPGLRENSSDRPEGGLYSTQVIDLTEAALSANPTDIAAGYLAQRISDGRSIFIVPGASTDKMPMALRHSLGIAYTFESVAELAPDVAYGPSGAHQGPVTLFFVGPKRPVALEAIPEAANRTFKVTGPNDIIELDREVQRSQRRIREWVAGQLAQAEDEATQNVPALIQVPYAALSKVSEPYTRVYSTLSGAMQVSLNRTNRFADGDVDGLVSDLLGVEKDDLGKYLIAEQVDAIATWASARDRGRSFLLADETGIGKGRSAAAAARAHVLTGGRVIMFTPSPDTNVPDVLRDLDALGVTARTRVLCWNPSSTMNARDGLPPVDVLTRPQMKSLLENGTWPEEYGVIVMTYSGWNSLNEEKQHWIDNAIDRDTLLILDESHCALNAKSGTGKAIRAMIDRVAYNNVFFLSATPMRRPEGIDLYDRLLPPTTSKYVRDSLKVLHRGGATELESFATMLAEDGASFRRVHDLGEVEFQVRAIEGDDLARVRRSMDSISPVFEQMIDLALAVRTFVNEASTRQYRAALAAGVPEDIARIQTRQYNNYMSNFGSPIASLARLAVNSLKADYLADIAIEKFNQGHKPLIPFFATNEQIFAEAARGQGAEGADLEEGVLTIKDHFIRQATKILSITLNGEPRQAHEISDGVREAYARLQRTIDLMPELSASPIDQIIDRMEDAGMVVGELTGRNVRYSKGQIIRRTKEEKDKLATMNGFNSGSIDALLYNKAADTGVTLSASKAGRDQRRRAVCLLELPPDPISFIQSMGRANRFNQVSAPVIVSLNSGMTAEIRMMQFMNRHLRRIGATVNGSREHPLLSKEMPDIFNSVGDRATYRVLLQNPDIANRLGFTEIYEQAMTRGNAGEEEETHEFNQNLEVSASDTSSLANQVLTRCMGLSSDTQEWLIQQIVLEFEAQVEILDSMGANPLRPKSYPGTIEFVGSTIYSGSDAPDVDSCFMRPMHLKTGFHHTPRNAFTYVQVEEKIQGGQITGGIDGFIPYSNIVRERMQDRLRAVVPQGTSIADALAAPHLQSTAFRSTKSRYEMMSAYLSQIRPGTAFTADIFQAGAKTAVVTSVMLPNPDNIENPAAYRFKIARIGMDKEETVSLSLLMTSKEPVRFNPSVDAPECAWIKKAFDNAASIGRERRPIQVLEGNILAAIGEAERQRLGALQLFREEGNASLHLGIIVDPQKIDLTRIPVPVPSPSVMFHAIKTRMDAQEGEGNGRRRNAMDENLNIAIYDANLGDRYSADMIVKFLVPERQVKLEVLPLNVGNYDYYQNRPGLHDVVYGKPLPEKVTSAGKRKLQTKTLNWDADQEEIGLLLNALLADEDHTVVADWVMRASFQQILEINPALGASGDPARLIDVDAMRARAEAERQVPVTLGSAYDLDFLDLDAEDEGDMGPLRAAQEPAPVVPDNDPVPAEADQPARRGQPVVFRAEHDQFDNIDDMW